MSAGSAYQMQQCDTEAARRWSLARQAQERGSSGFCELTRRWLTAVLLHHAACHMAGAEHIVQQSVGWLTAAKFLLKWKDIRTS